MIHETNFIPEIEDYLPTRTTRVSSQTIVSKIKIYIINPDIKLEKRDHANTLNHYLHLNSTNIS